ISRDHGTIERSAGGWSFVDHDSRNGSWIDGRRAVPREPVALENGARLQLARTLLVLRELPLGDAWSLTGEHPLLEIMSPALGTRFAELVRLTASMKPAVLLRGDTGSGKEVVARALH